ncbi:MAG: hypothetical protein CVV02_13355 [Firmicutes bacterium HGW-Firmicutes-7]|nr:MAG: hypothetical protein CVV02_13355 [Firmicutes bacterium HGW-Firmicutes-7]
MHNNNMDKLSKIIKTARKENNLTREQLAKKINITSRYLMSIENENKKPSYNVLFNLILDNERFVLLAVRNPLWAEEKFGLSIIILQEGIQMDDSMII